MTSRVTGSPGDHHVPAQGACRVLAPVTRDRRVVEFSTLSTHLTEPRRLNATFTKNGARRPCVRPDRSATSYDGGMKNTVIAAIVGLVAIAAASGQQTLFKRTV